MATRTALASLSALFGLLLAASTSFATPLPQPFCTGDCNGYREQNWGYRWPDGRIAIAPAYSAAEPFREGRAAVMVKPSKLWGYIDTQGQLVIPARFDLALGFSEERAAVRLKHKWGYIDATGREVVPLSYDTVGLTFSNGVGTITKDSIKGEMALVDREGKRLTGFKYKRIDKWSEGLAAATTDYKEWGYLNTSGHEVIGMKYTRAHDFSGGRALVGKGKGDSLKWGYIDSQGKEVIPVRYHQLDAFTDGLALVRVNDLHGYIDSSGKEIVPVRYHRLGKFNDGLAYAEIKNKAGYVDRDGREVIAVVHDVIDKLPNGNFRLRRDGKYGFADSHGQAITALKYTALGAYGDEGLARACTDNGKCGFVDDGGREVVPPQFDDASDFRNGMAAVRRNGKWGYVDSRGRLMIGLRYDSATAFDDNGFAQVSANGRRFRIDSNGQEAP